jgi:hypothetical protein
MDEIWPIGGCVWFCIGGDARGDGGKAGEADVRPGLHLRPKGRKAETGGQLTLYD